MPTKAVGEYHKSQGQITGYAFVFSGPGVVASDTNNVGQTSRAI